MSRQKVNFHNIYLRRSTTCQMSFDTLAHVTSSLKKKNNKKVKENEMEFNLHLNEPYRVTSAFYASIWFATKNDTYTRLKTGRVQVVYNWDCIKQHFYSVPKVFFDYIMEFL